MNSGIFMDYLRSINEKLDRKIVLLLVNFSGHYVDFEALENIVPIFLPPNATSVFQPLDLGIIRSFKSRYRNKVLFEYISRDEVGLPFKPVDLRSAIKFIHESWFEIPNSIITNCWLKSSLITRGDCGLKVAFDIDLLAEDDLVRMIDDLLFKFSENTPTVLDSIEELCEVELESSEFCENDDSDSLCEDKENDNFVSFKLKNLSK